MFEPEWPTQDAKDDMRPLSSRSHRLFLCVHLQATAAHPLRERA